MSVLPAGPVDHVGIAVRDLDDACARYCDLLGAEVTSREVVAGQQTEVAFLRLPGSARIELVAPTGPEGPVARFIRGRGEGLHHICILVENIDAALEQLEAAAVRRIDDEPRAGAEGSRIAFVHPVALGGVLLELKQKAG